MYFYTTNPTHNLYLTRHDIEQRP